MRNTVAIEFFVLPTSTFPNPGAIAEAAVDKRGVCFLMPLTARKQLFELPDNLATKINIEFYSDPVEAFIKAILD